VEDINSKGRYNLSNHENSKTRIFDRSPRQQLVYKHMLDTPAPGQ
jgi:sRNA-binding regulator protein Hfq